MPFLPRRMLLALLIGVLVPPLAGAQSPGATLVLQLLEHETGTPLRGAQVSLPE